MAEQALCFDMGGSKLETGIVDNKGHVLWKKRTEWQPKNGDDVRHALISTGKEALAKNPHILPCVVGATIPGVADPDTATWVSASFSGIENLPVGKWLSDAFSLPAYADNDAKACALAERLFGAGVGVSDFLYMTVSNGVGGAICCGGQLVRGAMNGAGELGHCTVVEEGRLCKCGKRGCLEAYAAGPGLRQTCKELGIGDVDGKALAALAKAGNPDALRAWELEGAYLGKAIAFAANLLNPQVVIIGGGLSLAFELYEHALLTAVANRLFAPPNRTLRIVPTPLGYDGALIGAAAVAFTQSTK